jgi:hypothetical protein
MPARHLRGARRGKRYDILRHSAGMRSVAPRGGALFVCAVLRTDALKIFTQRCPASCAVAVCVPRAAALFAAAICRLPPDMRARCRHLFAIDATPMPPVFSCRAIIAATPHAAH